MDYNDMLNLEYILDSINDGVYVTDKDRKIIFWNKSAERITGWMGKEIIGKRCCDNVLCHIDKDNHQLCAEDTCPLYRAMQTGEGSTVPVIVYAMGKNKKRIPMQVSVAPLKNEQGKTLGGVEIFREMREFVKDMERARKIQRSSLSSNVTDDPNIQIKSCYIPTDIVGGDFYTHQKLSNDNYAFLLADVMGHGMSAALYTMYLRSLWIENQELLTIPTEFLRVVNKKFCELCPENETFATCLLGLIDQQNKKIRFIGAGNPHPLIIHDENNASYIECSGIPLGMMQNVVYEPVDYNYQTGEKLLLYTDGAIEVMMPDKTMMGEEGLLALLHEIGYIENIAGLTQIEKEILNRSNEIRLNDDLTLVEITFIK